MRYSLAKVTRLEIAAALTPAAMLVAALTLPAQSNNSEDLPPMAFDSMGAMVRDMDREKSLDAVMAHYSVPGSSEAFAEAQDSCETDDVKSTLREVYARVQSQMVLSQRHQKILEQKELALRNSRDIDLSLREADASIQTARKTARAAALSLEAALAALRQETVQEAMEAEAMDEAAITAALEEAMRAAEAALDDMN